MKLTKAQRLFASVGKIEYEIMLQKNSCCPWDDDRAEGALIIKKLKARRKKLIREALRAYNIENGDAFTAGYKMCDRDHSIAGEFMLVDGDIIF